MVLCRILCLPLGALLLPRARADGHLSCHGWNGDGRCSTSKHLSGGLAPTSTRVRICKLQADGTYSPCRWDWDPDMLRAMGLDSDKRYPNYAFTPQHQSTQRQPDGAETRVRSLKSMLNKFHGYVMDFSSDEGEAIFEGEYRNHAALTEKVVKNMIGRSVVVHCSNRSTFCARVNTRWSHPENWAVATLGVGVVELLPKALRFAWKIGSALHAQLLAEGLQCNLTGGGLHLRVHTTAQWPARCRNCQRGASVGVLSECSPDHVGGSFSTLVDPAEAGPNLPECDASFVGTEKECKHGDILDLMDVQALLALPSFTASQVHGGSIVAHCGRSANVDRYLDQPIQSSRIFCARITSLERNIFGASFPDALVRGPVAISEHGLFYDVTIKPALQSELWAQGIECNLRERGVRFHVHSLWNHGHGKDYGVGASCSALFTGGHFHTPLKSSAIRFPGSWE